MISNTCLFSLLFLEKSSTNLNVSLSFVLLVFIYYFICKNALKLHLSLVSFIVMGNPVVQNYQRQCPDHVGKLLPSLFTWH